MNQIMIHNFFLIFEFLLKKEPTFIIGVRLESPSSLSPEASTFVNETTQYMSKWENVKLYITCIYWGPFLLEEVLGLREE